MPSTTHQPSPRSPNTRANGRSHAQRLSSPGAAATADSRRRMLAASGDSHVKQQPHASQNTGSRLSYPQSSQPPLADRAAFSTRRGEGDDSVNSLSCSFHSLPPLAPAKPSSSSSPPSSSTLSSLYSSARLSTTHQAPGPSREKGGQEGPMPSALTGHTRLASRQTTAVFADDPAESVSKPEEEDDDGFVTMRSHPSRGSLSRGSESCRSPGTSLPFMRAHNSARTRPMAELPKYGGQEWCKERLESAAQTATATHMGLPQMTPLHSRHITTTTTTTMTSEHSPFKPLTQWRSPLQRLVELHTTPLTLGMDSSAEAATRVGESASMRSLNSPSAFGVSLPAHLYSSAGDSFLADLTSFSVGFHQPHHSGERSEGSGGRAAQWVPQYDLARFTRQSSLPTVGGGSRGSADYSPQRRPHHNRYGGYRELDGQALVKPLHLHLAQQRRAEGLDVYGDPIPAQRLPGAEPSLLSRLHRYYCGGSRSTHDDGGTPPPDVIEPGVAAAAARGEAQLGSVIGHGLAWLVPFGLIVPFCITLLFTLLTHFSSLRLCGEKCYCTPLDSFLYVVTLGWFHYIPIATFTPALFVLFLAVGEQHDVDLPPPTPPLKTRRRRRRVAPVADANGCRCDATLAAPVVCSRRDGTPCANADRRGDHPRDEPADDDAVNMSMIAVEVRSSGSRTEGARRGVWSHCSSSSRHRSVFSSASLYSVTLGSPTVALTPDGTLPPQLRASYTGNKSHKTTAATATVGHEVSGRKEDDAHRPTTALLTATEEQEPRRRPAPDFLFASAIVGAEEYHCCGATESEDGDGQGGGTDADHTCTTCGLWDRLYPPPLLAVPAAGAAHGYAWHWRLPPAAATVARSRTFWVMAILRLVLVAVLDTQLPTTGKVPFLLYGFLRACVVTLPLFLYAGWLLLPLVAVPCFLLDYYANLLLVLFNPTDAEATADLGLVIAWPVLVTIVERLMAYLAVGGIKRCSADLFVPAGSSLSLALKTLLSTCFAALSYTAIFVAAVFLRVDCDTSARIVVPFAVVLLVAEALARSLVLERVVLWLLALFTRHVLLHRLSFAGPSGGGEEEGEGGNGSCTTTTVAGNHRTRNEDVRNEESAGVATALDSLTDLPHDSRADRHTAPPVILTGTTFACVSTRVRGVAALLAAVAVAPVFLYAQWPRDPTRPIVEHTITYATSSTSSVGLPLCKGYIAAAGEDGLEVHWPGFLIALGVAVLAEVLGVALSYVRDRRWQRELTYRNELVKGAVELEPTDAANYPAWEEVQQLLPSSAPLVPKDILLLVVLGWFTAAVGVSTALMAAPVWLPQAS